MGKTITVICDMMLQDGTVDQIARRERFKRDEIKNDRNVFAQLKYGEIPEEYAVKRLRNKSIMREIMLRMLEALDSKDMDIRLAQLIWQNEHDRAGNPAFELDPEEE